MAQPERLPVAAQDEVRTCGCAGFHRGLANDAPEATGMRSDEARTLRWSQVDVETEQTMVGKSKTEAGARRAIPMSKVLRRWNSTQPFARESSVRCSRSGTSSRYRTVHARWTPPGPFCL